MLCSRNSAKKIIKYPFGGESKQEIVRDDVEASFGSLQRAEEGKPRVPKWVSDDLEVINNCVSLCFFNVENPL